MTDSAELMRATIVTVDGEPFAGRDLVLAGLLAGLWEPMEHGLIAGIAALRSWTPPRDEVRALVRELRYARGLLSAREYEAWCAQRQFTPGAVNRAVERRLAAQRGAPSGPADAPSPDEVSAALPAEAVVAGTLRASARWLVDRVLALHDAPEQTVVANDVDALLAREDALLAPRFVVDAEAQSADRARRMIAAERAYQAQTRALCSPQALERVVRQRALDWLAVDLDVFTGVPPGPAAEIAALFREGVPAERISELSGLTATALSQRIDQAPEAIQGPLVAADIGDVIGPIAEGQTSSVYRVAARTPARVEDPAVRSAAAAALIESELDRRRSGRVSWHGRD